MGWHGSKISRIETGESSVHPGDVRDLVDMYQIIDDQQRDALVTLAREAKQRGWWMRYNDLFTSPFVGLEAEAASIRTYQPELIPGLLQTSDYATAVTRMALAGPDRNPSEVERRVAARMDRQKLLTAEDPPDIWAILDEAVLRLKPSSVRPARSCDRRRRHEPRTGWADGRAPIVGRLR
jgi:hypothetical protein